MAEKKNTTIVVFLTYIAYIWNTYYIEMAAGLSAELKINIKRTDKELSGFVDSSYFFIYKFIKDIPI
jgi:hypothetical protein